LGLSLNGSFRFGRQLENSSLLSLLQHGQKHDLAIRKFKGVMMRGGLIFVDLPKDRGAVLYRSLAPREETGRQAGNVAGKRHLRSWSNTDR
jgi:hypothetical protein